MILILATKIDKENNGNHHITYCLLTVDSLSQLRASSEILPWLTRLGFLTIPVSLPSHFCLVRLTLQFFPFTWQLLSLSFFPLSITSTSSILFIHFHSPLLVFVLHDWNCGIHFLSLLAFSLAEMVWAAGRDSNVQKSIFQPISRHPNLRVNILPTFGQTKTLL